MAPSYLVWSVGIVAVALLIFVVLPRFFASPAVAKQIVGADGASVGAVGGATAQETEAQRVAAAAAAEREASLKMLASQFGATQAAADVPDDYPRKKVGACPYSRPASAPLPMSSIPMCMAIQSDNMYLAGDAGHPGPLGSQAAGSGAVGACGSRTRPAGAPAPYDAEEPTTPTW